MISDKKVEMNVSKAYIDSYLLGKTIVMPDTINELGDEFDPYLDAVLSLAGKNDFAFLTWQLNTDGTPAAGYDPSVKKHLEHMLNIQK